MLVDEINKADRFLDELQAHIVIAGGTKISIEELQTWQLGTLLETIIPNKIKIDVSFEK